MTLLLGLTSAPSNGTTMIFLYRKNGGQVQGVSTDATAYAGVDATYYGTVTDPSAPDGADLGTPKFCDGVTVRNATAQEQSAFVTARVTDDNLIARQAAQDLYGADVRFRKILRAIASVMVDEINIVRQSPSTTFAARTLAQFNTAITNKITSGSVD